MQPSEVHNGKHWRRLLQGRTPLDLLSRELRAYLQAGTCAELFSWGNGANYQLGEENHAER